MAQASYSDCAQTRHCKRRWNGAKKRMNDHSPLETPSVHRLSTQEAQDVCVGCFNLHEFRPIRLQLGHGLVTKACGSRLLTTLSADHPRQASILSPNC
jgi:hypothetical protein